MGLMGSLHGLSDKRGPFFGHPVDLGLMGSEISFFCSELIFFISTLFKFSSEKKNFCSELFYPYFGGKKSGLETSHKYLQIKGAGEPIKGFLRLYPVFRAHLPPKLNHPKNQAFACEKLANMGVPR